MNPAAPIEVVPVDPSWRVRRRWLEQVQRVSAIEPFSRNEPLAAEQLLSRYRLPAVQQ